MSDDGASGGGTSRRRAWLGPLVGLLVVGGVVVVMGERFVRGMVYPAPLASVPSPPPQPFEEVELATAAGHHVIAWAYDPGGSSAGPAVAFFHGNGENLETMRQAGQLGELTALGVPFLAVDYPGYGRSGGTPSEAANVAAAVAALDWLGERHPGRRRVAAGWSLGAAVALQAAAHHPERVDAVAVLSPWTSLRDVAARFYPRLLVRAALRDRYDSLGAAPRIHRPALVVHGGDDWIIPVDHGRQVAAALPGPTRWVEVPGAGHNDLFAHRETWAALSAFLAEAR